MVNFKEDEALNTLNHSCAHLMAQAIRHLYPQAKFWVGPVVAEGFYYDVDFGDHVFKEEDMAAIEKEMKKIAKRGFKIIRKEISKEEVFILSRRSVLLHSDRRCIIQYLVCFLRVVSFDL